ncbi:hypothetical protein ACHAXN_008945 [Cyclotella atomus]|jgi:hypothetical protein
MIRILSTSRLAYNPSNPLLQYYYRHITTASAKSMLGFTEHCQFTIRELRHAYFEAAKLHHPDVVKQQQLDPNIKVFDFRDITNAYEHLLTSSHVILSNTSEPIITHDEEEEYRTACLDILGIPAEIVEESKKNPMFRQWLMGKTDAAMHWKMFLSKYGGLAEKLRPRVQLGMGEGVGKVRRVDGRRKRRR